MLFKEGGNAAFCFLIKYVCDDLPLSPSKFCTAEFGQGGKTKPAVSFRGSDCRLRLMSGMCAIMLKSLQKGKYVTEERGTP